MKLQTEKELLEFLKDWCIHKKTIMRLEENLHLQGYSITTSYSDTKTFSSGTPTSKVENYCLSLMEIQEELDALKMKIRLCINAYENSGLTNLERKTIHYTCTGKSLLRLSKDLKMAQARIYRIRDNAIKKMFFRIQNEVNN